MAKLNTQQIKEKAKAIIRAHPGGVRYGQLLKEILKGDPDTPGNTVQGSIWNLHQQFPSEIAKPSRGLFTAISTGEPIKVAPPTGKLAKLKEDDFYQPFAEWLKTDLDEVTDAVALGGAAMKNKWGTPDVLGVYKALASNLIKFPLEVVSAEIKIDPGTPVVAFGQAIAYRLFSAKSYIAMPTSITAEDLGRLESLCMLFGVGLVLFDLDPKTPNFSIRMRAQRFSPDMFYVNELADRLREVDNDTFEKLFR